MRQREDEVDVVRFGDPVVGPKELVEVGELDLAALGRGPGGTL